MICSRLLQGLCHCKRLPPLGTRSDVFYSPDLHNARSRLHLWAALFAGPSAALVLPQAAGVAHVRPEGRGCVLQGTACGPCGDSALIHTWRAPAGGVGACLGLGPGLGLLGSDRRSHYDRSLRADVPRLSSPLEVLTDAPSSAAAAQAAWGCSCAANALAAIMFNKPISCSC
jgi:hypothetical protein